MAVRCRRTLNVARENKGEGLKRTNRVHRSQPPRMGDGTRAATTFDKWRTPDCCAFQNCERETIPRVERELIGLRASRADFVWGRRLRGRGLNCARTI